VFNSGCTTGKKVLGCQMFPLRNGAVDYFRAYFPALAGTGDF
jgi:hypothetical protein